MTTEEMMQCEMMDLYYVHFWHTQNRAGENIHNLCMQNQDYFSPGKHATIMAGTEGKTYV